ncbi:helix-turn-helix transcriptional regulator [Leptothoe sp. EHU-05/26/07-4]
MKNTTEIDNTAATMLSAPKPPKINEALQMYIEGMGLSQAAFGRKIGAERATVNGWLRQGKRPSAKLFLEIADRLDEDPQELNEKLGFNLDLQEAQTERALLQRLEEEVASLSVRVDQLSEAIPAFPSTAV